MAKKKSMTKRERAWRQKMRRDPYSRLSLAVKDYLATVGWNVVLTSGSSVQSASATKRYAFEFVVPFGGSQRLKKNEQAMSNQHRAPGEPPPATQQSVMPSLLCNERFENCGEHICILPREHGGAHMAASGVIEEAAAPSVERPEQDDLQIRAESLYEELGGDLCSCQNADSPLWCENCQRRIALIYSTFIHWKQSATPDPASASQGGAETQDEVGAMVHRLAEEITDADNPRHNARRRQTMREASLLIMKLSSPLSREDHALIEKLEKASIECEVMARTTLQQGTFAKMHYEWAEAMRRAAATLRGAR